MKCIMCGEDLQFKAGGAPLFNVEQYGNPANAKTACCGKMLRIFPRRKITVTAILVFAPVSAFFYYAFKILNTLHAAGV